ncbi:hypothetical protein E2C01_059219 [Portunus trituberculatus]|uniref:Uncharacterized protein n=1 Tax=Portunus trituberculatus TaxID=210409 RepID=A0A5B7H4R9_PORTR|nr:hypothetical protein [Portunus trituberculatus]
MALHCTARLIFPMVPQVKPGVAYPSSQQMSGRACLTFPVYFERHVSQVSDTRGADLYRGCGRQRRSKHARTFYPSSCLFQTVECRRDGHGRTGEEGRAARREPGRARARRGAVQTQPQAHSAGDAARGKPAAG